MFDVMAHTGSSEYSLSYAEESFALEIPSYEFYGTTGRCGRCGGCCWLPDWRSVWCAACGWHRGDPTDSYRERRRRRGATRAAIDERIDADRQQLTDAERVAKRFEANYLRDVENDRKNGHKELNVLKVKKKPVKKRVKPRSETRAAQARRGDELTRQVMRSIRLERDEAIAHTKDLAIQNRKQNLPTGTWPGVLPGCGDIDVRSEIDELVAQGLLPDLSDVKVPAVR